MTWARQGSDVSAEFHHTRRERFEINWTRWTARWRHLTCRNHLRNPPKANTTRHKSIEKYWNLENSQFTKKCYKRFLPPVIKWSFPPNLLHDSLQKSPSNGQIGCDLWKKYVRLVTVHFNKNDCNFNEVIKVGGRSRVYGVNKITNSKLGGHFHRSGRPRWWAVFWLKLASYTVVDNLNGRPFVFF